MYEEQISPLIAFIFYPPYKYKNVACMKVVTHGSSLLMKRFR